MEVADRNAIKQLGVFIEWNVQGNSFRTPKKYKRPRQAVWFTRNLHGFFWNSGRLDYSELPNFLLRDVMAEYFAKKQKNARFLPVQWGKCWKTWMIMAVPKFSISVMKKCGFARVTHSDTRPHFTLPSARQNCLVAG